MPTPWATDQRFGRGGRRPWHIRVVRAGIATRARGGAVPIMWGCGPPLDAPSADGPSGRVNAAKGTRALQRAGTVARAGSRGASASGGECHGGENAMQRTGFTLHKRLKATSLTPP